MTSEDDGAPTSAGRGPSDETTITPPATVADPRHAWSEEEPITEALSRPWRSAWVIAGIGLGCAVAVAFAIFGAVALLRDGATQTAPTTPTQAARAPALESPAVAPATTTAEISSRLLGTDDLGWTAYPGARCDPGDKPAVMARTTLSVVVVCEIQPGNFYYRGVPSQRWREHRTPKRGAALLGRLRHNQSDGRDSIPHQANESYDRAADWTGVLRADVAVRIRLDNKGNVGGVPTAAPSAATYKPAPAPTRMPQSWPTTPRSRQASPVVNAAITAYRPQYGG